MKKLYAGLLALLMAVALTVPAQAKEFSNDGTNWQVSFTADKKMTSNFTTSQINELLYGMQPGDTAEITLTLGNQNEESTDWYMTNTIIKSLEDRKEAAKGGAYSYYLAYSGPSGERVLYDSSNVGGDDTDAGKGLNEVDSNLDDWFYLDTLPTGSKGYITLRVGLDGETQGNTCQDTLAELEMNFAVELRDTQPNILERTIPAELRGRRTTIVSTGDIDMTPYFVAAALSGLLLLIYAVISYRAQRRNKRKGR